MLVLVIEGSGGVSEAVWVWSWAADDGERVCDETVSVSGGVATAARRWALSIIGMEGLELGQRLRSFFSRFYLFNGNLIDVDAHLACRRNWVSRVETGSMPRGQHFKRLGEGETLTGRGWARREDTQKKGGE